MVAFLAGVFFLKFLTAHPLRASLYLSLTWACILGSLILISQPMILDQVGWAVLAWSVFFVGGYALQTKFFLSREDHRQLPLLTRQKGDPGDGHSAVIYFTHGEPETYDPIGWLNQFREFDEQRIPFVPFLARPFFIYPLLN